jgi:gliding motility-associated lipoprotein GldH
MLTVQKLRMKTRILKNSFLMLLLVFCFFSCDEKQIFDQYKTIEGGWHKDSLINFTFNRVASKTPYNLFINIRNDDDYEFNNLFLIVKLENPEGLTKVDTLEYLMANPDGTFLGKGFSDVKESKLWYKEKITFPKTGDYKATIQQVVRQTGKVKGIEKLKGITEVGFRIESL